MTRSLGRILVLLTIALAACALPHWPVEGPMTSAYGLRFRGLLPEIHRGVDIAVPVGTPVRAMKAGRVQFAGVLGGYGNVVILEHGGRLETLYAHLSRIDVRAGDEVGHEQVIGLSGRSGNATGPHVHFEIRRWGHAEDPVPLLGRHPRSGG